MSGLNPERASSFSILPRSVAKCPAIAVGVVLCACLMWPTAALAAGAHHGKDATLRVVVRSLPGRLLAKIIVTGPHHVHKRVSRSVTLRLPAGAYSLSAAPVKSSSGSYYATTPRSRVVLDGGRATSLVVAYATMVPKSTLVVPASATSSLAGDPSGPRVLTITGPAAETVKVGDSLSSGVTSAAPYGYLVKVTKIAHKSGSSATLDVENTTLLAALPTGEINAEQALEPTAEAASAGNLKRVDLTVGRELHGAHARAAGFTINTDDLECESSAGVHLGKPTLTFSPSMAVHAHWGFLKLDSASISVTAAESLTFGAVADAGAHCSTSSPGIGLLPHPVTLDTFDIQVGPVPVTVTPKLQLYLTGQASIEAKATFSLEQGASVTVGAAYEHGSFHPISSLSQHFTPAFTAEGDASGEVALTPTVDTLIYDVAGPSFDVGAVAKLNANVKASPWWTLQGCLQAGLGFVISPLGLNWSDPHLIQLCKTLLSATSGPPSTGGGAPPGGGGGGTTPPGGGGGGGSEGSPGAGWTLESPPGLSSTDSGLDNVSCVAANWCLALAGNESAPTEIWNGSSWSAAAEHPADLTSATCLSTSWCMGVGNDSVGATWNGSSWTENTMPTPSGSPEAYSYIWVSCASASYCVAVGDATYSGGELVPISARWDGSIWTALNSPGPSGSIDTDLVSVSCPVENNCTAVGGYDNDEGIYTGEAYADHWNGSTWTIQTVPNPSGGVWSGLNGVSCPTTSSCVAVGYWDAGLGSNVVPLAENLNGGSWSSSGAVLPTGSVAGETAYVSCHASTECEAVGQYYQEPTDAPLAESWNGSTWTAQSAPDPLTTAESDFNGVSCPTSTACVATGTSLFPSPESGSRAFAEVYSGSY
jgi:hypothetical protein